ncbi:MAG TPA: hypothetical protein PKC39_09570 [Ferruginibacter sp.]|nr:hypothetical protein [Ferruginibacter sp.]HMP21195.1 hypothetical protein [Ferruginibacter sp.]
MKKQLHYFIFFTLLVTVSLSCKKNSGNTDYFVKIKQDGNWTTFTKVAGEFGPDLLDPSFTNLVIAAESNSGTEAFTIAIQGTSLSAGTYDTDNTTVASTSLVYITQATTSPRAHTVDASMVAVSRYMVNITSITATEIEGTFTGNFLYDSFNDNAANITEGQFKVKRIR